MQHNHQKKLTKKNDYEAPNLKVRSIIFEKEDSVFLALEEYGQVITTSNNGKYTTTTYTYYYEDILGAKIDAQGIFYGSGKFPKNNVDQMQTKL